MIAICHLNKKADLDAIERLLGSVAFANVSRSVLLIDNEPPESPEDKRKRKRIVHAKHNLSPRGADMIYEVVHMDISKPRAQRVKAIWEKAEHDVDASAMFQKPKDDNRRKSARAWLFDYLNTKGPARKSDVLIAADKEGFTRAAIEKAYTRSEIFEGDVQEFHGEATWSLVTR